VEAGVIHSQLDDRDHRSSFVMCFFFTVWMRRINVREYLHLFPSGQDYQSSQRIRIVQ
jgi:hypothetical protein